MKKRLAFNEIIIVFSKKYHIMNLTIFHPQKIKLQ